MFSVSRNFGMLKLLSNSEYRFSAVILVFAVYAAQLGWLSAAAADTLADVLDRGAIRIGISPGAAPLGFYNERNEPVGYDVDMARSVAEALGVVPEFVNVYGDSRVSMLVSGQLDLVIANMTATPGRAKSVDFSRAYLRTGLRIIVRKDSGIESFAELDGRKIVVGRGSSGEVFIRDALPGAELVYTDSFSPNGVLLLRQGRVAAAIEDNSIIDYLAAQSPDYEILPELYFSGPIAMGIAKGNPEFLAWINTFITAYISEGRYQQQFRKWWGSDSQPPSLENE